MMRFKMGLVGALPPHQQADGTAWVPNFFGASSLGTSEPF
jgi:hypothetical protein